MMPDDYAPEQPKTANSGRSPGDHIWLRAGVVLWGVITFVWMAPEDDSVLPPVLLGLWLSALLVLWLTSRLALRPSRLVTAAVGLVAGLMIGAGTGPCAVLLMVVKNARHGHLYPDYPPDVLLDTLARVPHWALAGGLIGIGIICFRWAARRGPVSPV